MNRPATRGISRSGDSDVSPGRPTALVGHVRPHPVPRRAPRLRRARSCPLHGARPQGRGRAARTARRSARAGGDDRRPVADRRRRRRGRRRCGVAARRSAAARRAGLGREQNLVPYGRGDPGQPGRVPGRGAPRAQGGRAAFLAQQHLQRPRARRPGSHVRAPARRPGPRDRALHRPVHARPGADEDPGCRRRVRRVAHLLRLHGRRRRTRGRGPRTRRAARGRRGVGRAPAVQRPPTAGCALGRRRPRRLQHPQAPRQPGRIGDAAPFADRTRLGRRRDRPCARPPHEHEPEQSADGVARRRPRPRRHPRIRAPGCRDRRARDRARGRQGTSRVGRARRARGRAVRGRRARPAAPLHRRARHGPYRRVDRGGAVGTRRRRTRTGRGTGDGGAVRAR